MKKPSPAALTTLKRTVNQFYQEHGRTFPWRDDPTPYHVLVSELMLQQTQTDRVLPKYTAFIASFPDLTTLATASPAAVLSHWQGLGYNRRGRFLHQTAQRIVEQFQGRVPSDSTELQTLPGIGPYTAAAIATFAYNQPHVLLETNIRTVYIHHFFREVTGKVADTELIPLIEATIDRSSPRDWYAALMDYGSYLKKRFPNPTRRSKHYAKQSTFQGSNRQVRGSIIRYLTTHQQLAVSQLPEVLDVKTTPAKALQAVGSLVQDEMIVRRGEILMIPDSAT